MILTEVTLTTTAGATVTLGAPALIGGHAVGYTLDKADVSPAPRAPRQQTLPLVGGGVVTPGRPGIRTIEVEGLVIGRTASETNGLARALVEVLADEGDMGFTAIAFEREGTEVQLLGTLDGRVDLEERGGTLIRYRARLVCPDPTAYALDSRSVAAAASPGTDFDVYGDVPAWPTFTLTASGAVTSLRIGNTTTGRFVQLDGLDLDTGDEVVITTRPGYEAITINDANGMAYRASTSRWVRFVPGANRLYVTVLGGAGTLTAAATWADGWVV